MRSLLHRLHTMLSSRRNTSYQLLYHVLHPACGYQKHWLLRYQEAIEEPDSREKKVNTSRVHGHRKSDDQITIFTGILSACLCMRVCLCVCLCVCMYVYVCSTHTHTHIHTDIHIHTHTHTYTAPIYTNTSPVPQAGCIHQTRVDLGALGITSGDIFVLDSSPHHMTHHMTGVALPHIT